MNVLDRLDQLERQTRMPPPVGVEVTAPWAKFNADLDDLERLSRRHLRALLKVARAAHILATTPNNDNYRERIALMEALQPLTDNTND